MLKNFIEPIKGLLLVWLILIGLTVGTMITGKVTQNVSLSLVWAVGLFAVTLIKSRLILNYYLELKSASGSWGRLFNALVYILISILALILAYQVYS